MEKVKLANGRITLIRGDCLEVMPKIRDGIVDMVFADLPYGVLSCAWDCVLPLDVLWREYKRLGKPKAVSVFTANQQFATTLVISNREWFKYDLIWSKGRGFSPQLANICPMRSHENVLIFCSGKTVYNPQKIELDKPYKRKSPTINRLSGKGQNLFSVNTVRDEDKLYTHSYPLSIVDVHVSNSPNKIHPTQKPVGLLEWLIRTYTNPNDLVLDNVMGSGTTGVACINTGRRFIGIEKDIDKDGNNLGYFDHAVNRCKEALAVKERELVS